MKNKTYTYSELHNRAVRSFRKAMSAFAFIAIMNFLGPILYLIKGNTGYFPSLISNVLIFRLLSNTSISDAIYIMLTIIIGIIFSVIFILVWVPAKSGNIKAIITGSVLYLLDTILLFIFYLQDSYLIPQLFLHVIIIAFLIAGILNYYHVFAIERKFKK